MQRRTIHVTSMLHYLVGISVQGRVENAEFAAKDLPLGRALWLIDLYKSNGLITDLHWGRELHIFNNILFIEIKKKDITNTKAKINDSYVLESLNLIK